VCTIRGSGNILGTAGDNVIGGGPGNDKVFGGLGNDSVLGSAGVDFLSAGPGADRITADANERVDIGAGPGDQCLIGGVAGCPPRLS